MRKFLLPALVIVGLSSSAIASADGLDLPQPPRVYDGLDLPQPPRMHDGLDLPQPPRVQDGLDLPQPPR